MTTTNVALHGHLEATGGVSSTVSKGLAWSLREAEFLDLLYVVNGEPARRLAADLLPAIEAAEARTRARGPKERVKLIEALNAVLGGVLVPGLTKSRVVHRAMGKGTFDGRIGYLQAKPVLDGLQRGGFLICYPGIRFLRAVDGGGQVPAGMTSRYEATAALYALAASHGVTEETASANYARSFPTRPAKVRELLTLRTHEARKGRKAPRGGGASGMRLPIPSGDPVATTLRREVKMANAALARDVWGNCQPPQVYRAFRENWTLGGRWIVAGAATIQTMPSADRLRITIDGGPVVECDATASQLTILAGLAGVAQLPPNPYCLPGFSRAEVKSAVVVSLGRGRLITRWPRRTLEEHPELAEVDARALSAALGVAYPFLKDPGAVLGVVRERVSLRLQAIEAGILTRALVPLWQAHIPAVPIHDGILAPAVHAERVRSAMQAAYKDGAAGAVVGVTADGL